MAKIPANNTLTEEGKRFIRQICKGEGRSLLDGTKGPLPHSNDGNGNLVNKTWVSNAQWNGNRIKNNEELGEALIEWYEKYGQIYNLDPNVLAAQAYAEGGYIIWNYNYVGNNISKSSTASGTVQFIMRTVYSIIVNNFSNIQPKMTQDEIDAITNGLELRLTKEAYFPTSGDLDTRTVAAINRGILHQNITDNPEIMVKAQARYMKYFSDQCDRLASTSLFCYNRGSAFISSTYSQAIQKAQNYKKGGEDYYVEGVKYVKRIFGILGDKENRIITTKPKGYYFGYDKLNLTEPFNAFEANTEEAEVYGITLDRLSIADDDNYTFVDFPEEDYIRVPKTPYKTQVVLHHTVSGPYGYGGGVARDIQHFRSLGERVSVHFLVSREGGIFQLFNIDNYGFHLGLHESFLSQLRANNSNISTNSILNKQSIGIEIDSWGGLIEFNGSYYPTPMDADGDLQIFNPRENSTPVPIQNVQLYNSSTGYPKGFRGFYAFEKYTSKQIESLKNIIISLKEFLQNDLDVTFQPDLWDINLNSSVKSSDGAKGISENALSAKSGIWSHTSFRPDKSDVHPQPELIAMLQEIASITTFDTSFARNRGTDASNNKIFGSNRNL